MIVIRKIPGTVYGMTVTECMHHLPVILMSGHRTPPAFAFNTCWRHGPWCMWLDHNQVGFIPLSDISALFHSEKRRRTMAHQLHHTFYRQHALVYQLQRSEEH